jgi:hypothetical protein
LADVGQRAFLLLAPLLDCLALHALIAGMRSRRESSSSLKGYVNVCAAAATTPTAESNEAAQSVRRTTRIRASSRVRYEAECLIRRPKPWAGFDRSMMHKLKTQTKNIGEG